MEKQKIKLIKEKPEKIYTAVIDADVDFIELISFLEKNKDKKFSVIINGKMYKFSTVAFKNRFIDGLKASNDILSKFKEKGDTSKLSAELKKELEEARKIKEMYLNKELSMSIRISNWSNRIAELEDTCETLSKELLRREQDNVIHH